MDEVSRWHIGSLVFSYFGASRGVLATLRQAFLILHESVKALLPQIVPVPLILSVLFVLDRLIKNPQAMKTENENSLALVCSASFFVPSFY